jgi:hypothetical protein
MKRIKLFETFNIESFDDIDDILLSLQEQGILKLKSKPFISYDESERGTQTLGNLNPKISVIYELNKELLKIDSIEKISRIKKLIDEIHQAVSRLNVDYLLDFTKFQFEINLPVPPNISDIFENIWFSPGGRIVFTKETHLRKTIFGNDTEAFDSFSKLLEYIKPRFTVDENFNISVSTVLVDWGSDIEHILNTLIKYFEGFGLKHTSTTKDNSITSHKYYYRLDFVSQ